MYKIINEQKYSNIVLVHKLHKHETNLTDVLFIPWIRLSINKQSSFFKNGEITKFNVICKISKDKVLCVTEEYCETITTFVFSYQFVVQSQSSCTSPQLFRILLFIKSNYIPIHSKDTQWRLEKQSQELVGYWGRS